MKTKLIFWVFISVSIVNLVAQIVNSAELDQFTKPILMPLLLYYIYESSRGKVTLRVLLLSLAVLLSWIGDVTLLQQAEEIYFMMGIGLFFLAHAMYIIVLKKSVFQSVQFDVLKVLPFALFAIILFKFLIPNAGDFAIPIFIYGIAISVMAGTARLREGNTSQESYRLAMYGSILFLISDSLLAIDKFYAEIPLNGLWVMSTYITAQVFLVKGILKHVD